MTLRELSMAEIVLNGTDKALTIGLVIEDGAFRQQAQSQLIGSGYNVWVVPDAKSLYRQLLSCRASILVIDLGDPENFEAMRYLISLEEFSMIAIGPDNDSRLEIESLACGADRYLRKPLCAERLQLNIEALLRRFAAGVSCKTLVQRLDGIVWQLDSKKWLLISPNGDKMPLTFCEYTLLKLLMEAQGHPVACEILITQLFPQNESTKRRDIHMLVYRFRKKIKDA